MVQENQNYISFYPGNTNGSQARLFIHDRFSIEKDVLPRYFNHSSFASLRRQLNYFNFTRIGRGRQRGATYVNKSVFDLDDILRLKRRETGSPVIPDSGPKLNKKKEHLSEKLPILLDLTIDNTNFTTYQGNELPVPYDDLHACNILLAMSCKARL